MSFTVSVPFVLKGLPYPWTCACSECSLLLHSSLPSLSPSLPHFPLFLLLPLSPSLPLSLPSPRSSCSLSPSLPPFLLLPLSLFTSLPGRGDGGRCGGRRHGPDLTHQFCSNFRHCQCNWYVQLRPPQHPSSVSYHTPTYLVARK